MAGLMNKVVVPLSVVLALIGVVLAWSDTSKYKKLMADSQQMQQQLMNLQVQRQQVGPRVQQLLQEIAAYGQGRPAIEQLLARYGLRFQPTTPAPSSAQPLRPAPRTSPTSKSGIESGTGR
jgi:hypothetical protein